MKLCLCQLHPVTNHMTFPLQSYIYTSWGWGPRWGLTGADPGFEVRGGANGVEWMGVGGVGGC